MSGIRLFIRTDRKQAESLFAEGLERSTRVLGQDHPETVALQSDHDELRP